MPSLSDSQAESGDSDEEVEYFVPPGSPESALGRELPKCQLPAQPWLDGGRAAAVNGGGLRGWWGVVCENERVTRSRLGQSGRPSQSTRGQLFVSFVAQL